MDVISKATSSYIFVTVIGISLHIHIAAALPTATTTTLIRSPSHDSAIIQSDRFGGNFAYSTLEGHAYAAVSPIVRNAQIPIAIDYTAQIAAAAAPIPIYASQYASSYIPSTSVIIHH